MFDLNQLTIDELNELRRKISDTIIEKLNDKGGFCEKILKLRELISTFENEKIALDIEGEDIQMRLLFNEGVTASFDVLEYSSEFDADAYNEDEYEELFVSGKSERKELDNFFIPLFGDFEASSDVSILEDDEEEMRDYDNILLIIKTDTIDYIFTRLV